MVGGVLLPWGWVLTVVVALLLLWLLYLSWPRFSTPERMMRLAVLAIVLAVLVTQVVPR
jgi:ABC-type Co2+ transport system permease subunit